MERCSHLQESICPLPVQRSTSRVQDLLNDTGGPAGKLGGCWIGGRQLVCSGSKRCRKSGGSCVVERKGGRQYGSSVLKDDTPDRNQACRRGYCRRQGRIIACMRRRRDDAQRGGCARLKNGYFHYRFAATEIDVSGIGCGC